MYNTNNIIALMCVEGIGPVSAQKLMSIYKDPEIILNLSKKELLDNGVLSESSIQCLVNKDYMKSFDIQLNWLEHSKTKLTHLWDSDYPDILKQIYDPPVLLFYYGELTEKDEFTLGVVGSRHPDNYGKQITSAICDELAVNNIIIVSGMARGIDAISHHSALKNNTRTIAVLGTSLDTIYPAENKKLAKRIQEKGAVISEFLVGRKRSPAHFVRRNRIISGLSRGVLVTQAGDKSGALITGFNAIDQNREVFAIPGNVLNDRNKGCHRLIKHGAKLVENFSDILSEFSSLQEKLHEQTSWIPQSVANIKVSGEEQKILDYLASNEVHIDMITQETDLSPSSILSALLNLELRGYIKQLPGKYFKRTI